MLAVISLPNRTGILDGLSCSTTANLDWVGIVHLRGGVLSEEDEDKDGGEITAGIGGTVESGGERTDVEQSSTGTGLCLSFKFLLLRV